MVRLAFYLFSAKRKGFDVNAVAFADYYDESMNFWSSGVNFAQAWLCTIVRLTYTPAHYWQFKGMVELWSTLRSALPDLVMFTMFLLLIVGGFSQVPRPPLSLSVSLSLSISLFFLFSLLSLSPSIYLSLFDGRHAMCM